MDSQSLFRQLLRVPSSYRTFLHASTRPQTRTFALIANAHQQQRYISLPRIISPSFWANLIPKRLRRDSQLPEAPAAPAKANKEWNPAKTYIVLAMLVGSQAIQIIWLKRDRDAFTRRAEAKIGVLREVIEKVQRGEDVEVEKVLGTGDEAAEAEWKEVMKELGDEELLFRSKKRRRAMRLAEEEAAAREIAGREDEERKEGGVVEEPKVKVEAVGDAKFY